MGEGAHGLADGAAGDLQLAHQLRLGRDARADGPVAGGDTGPDPVDDLVGQRRAAYRFEGRFLSHASHGTGRSGRTLHVGHQTSDVLR